MMLSIQPDSNLTAMINGTDSRVAKPPPFARQQRVTRDGRHLWYQLEVLQQPERARACGSGPKSSADRRPVDPPPVVVLKVYEGEHLEGARDITFDYNVDFFCYASLEHARPIAQGRVPTSAAASPPVLTGFPVSGCCYLDRPDPAGYFLFPDLSVRHEGRYRLVFSLYELIKNAADLDRDGPDVDSTVQLPVDACHRMDLKSSDFTVFSAKKFPGLTESTSLSRTVAEQGCRVRIRRDVRMRRRDNTTKPSGGDEYTNNAEDRRAATGGTPAPDGYRPRSVSNSSVDRSSFPDRRASNVEYPGAPPPPPAYPSAKPAGALLNFGGQPTNGFAQPSYGSMGSSNPQSTPVSPAQPAFPQQNGNLPSPAPSYQGSSYPPPYEQPESEGKRSSVSYPPHISAKPLRSAELRPSISNGSRENGQRPILPSISVPAEHDLQQYSDREYNNLYPMKNGLYPQAEARQVKRGADESFMAHQHRRNLVGEALPMMHQQQIYPLTHCYMRADGKKAYPPADLWLN